MILDETDRRILNRIQTRFPIARRPYGVIAEDLGLTENEVMSRIRRLKEKDVIRRIGGNFVPEKVGFVSTLCAARVPETAIEHFAEVVNRYPGVTHNYQRDNAYNIWFTFIAPSMAEIEEYLRQIEQQTGVTPILNMPATRVFKIRAKFDL
ncbi:MAG: AsnC family transcriptional regulator [Desulfobacterales bacterium]|jgi:DNA-binding Lrp family transcriptional regulator